MAEKDFQEKWDLGDSFGALFRNGQVQRISILTPTEGISCGVGDSVRLNNLKKCMQLNWNSQRGGGLRKYPFCGRRLDIFWNYTIQV